MPAGGQYHSLLSELSSKFGCLVCENVRHACRTTTPCCWRRRCGGASLCFFRFLLEHKCGGNVSIVRSSSLKLRTMVVVIMCSSRILEIILQPNKTKLSHNSSTVSIHRRPEKVSQSHLVSLRRRRATSSQQLLCKEDINTGETLLRLRAFTLPFSAQIRSILSCLIDMLLSPN